MCVCVNINITFSFFFGLKEHTTDGKRVCHLSRQREGGRGGGVETFEPGSLDGFSFFGFYEKCIRVERSAFFCEHMGEDNRRWLTHFQRCVGGVEKRVQRTEKIINK